ncbi:MAG: hypothetical protein MUC28_00940 [Planctomycetes bacterium]|jgi:hypothetical protein|nr:hypothetical protein [Planctomycetota bacterium]
MEQAEEILFTNREKKMEIKDAGTYQSAIADALEKLQTGAIEEAKTLLAAAESWLNSIRTDAEFLADKDRATPEKLAGRWLDHREASLFQAFRKIGDFAGAQRIVDAMNDTPHALSVKSKEGRIKILKQEMDTAKADK